jgi:hypothetical protein
MEFSPFGMELERRQVLRLLGLGATGLALSGCDGDPDDSVSIGVDSPKCLDKDRNTPGTYPRHPGITATVFYIGEPATPENDNITNEVLAWDSRPVETFGGVDDVWS